jgi:hypothetical protein
MPTLKERILALVSSTPGITDTQLAGSLRKRHQAVNSAARGLESAGQLVRLNVCRARLCVETSLK